MGEKISNIVVCVSMLVLLTVFGAWLLFRTPDPYSAGERRVLLTKTEFSPETVRSGKFMSEYEKYALDQFPLRDTFRTLKAINERYVLGKLDSNGLFFRDGYLSKLEYPLNEAMLDHAADRFAYLYENYMKEQGITPCLVIVPDKNYFLAEKNGMLSLDYEALYDKILEETDYMKPIEIRDLLDIGDYYATDTHWRQDRIRDVAQRILDGMGIPAEEQAIPDRLQKLDIPFYGVYVGQSALPVKPDTIQYYDSDVISSCTVFNYDTGMPKEALVYDAEAAGGRDGYDFFLEGASALITIENPKAAADRELVIFRDSFGSSLAPLLIGAYRKITLVDIRYIQSGMVGNFVQFEDQDVLFEYSTLLLNNSMGLR